MGASMTWAEVFAAAYNGFKCFSVLGLMAVGFVLVVYCIPVGLWIGTTAVLDTYRDWRLKRLERLHSREEIHKAIQMLRIMNGDEQDHTDT